MLCEQSAACVSGGKYSDQCASNAQGRFLNMKLGLAYRTQGRIRIFSGIYGTENVYERLLHVFLVPQILLLLLLLLLSLLLLFIT